MSTKRYAFEFSIFTINYSKNTRNDTNAYYQENRLTAINAFIKYYTVIKITNTKNTHRQNMCEYQKRYIQKKKPDKE